jgi:hypothetical protein
LCAKRSAFRGDSGGCHEVHSRIPEDLVKGLSDFSLWKCCSETLNLVGIGIENPAQFSSGFNQTVALAIDVAVIEGNGSKFECARPAHRLGFTLRSVVVTCLIH